MLNFSCITQKSSPLAGALTAILLFSSAGTAHAYQCKVVYKYAEAIAPTKAQNVASVKVIWHNKVNDIYGLQWSAWDIAKSKQITCSATGNNQWCRAKAKPCLYVIN